jgi:hypothetical protein
MNQKNRETMQRAIGLVEGVAWASDEKQSDALMAVVEMLDTVMKDEEEE